MLFATSRDTSTLRYRRLYTVPLAGVTPRLVMEGHDPQLEKAVEIVLQELEKNPRRQVERPPPANRVM